MIHEDAGAFPTRVFDTQIAAGLIGLTPQVGYAKLVETYCDIKLAKAHTRTNWSRRPLGESVLQYAADDVRYLRTIRDRLSERADELGRLEWIEEDCRELLNPARYQVDPDLAWERLRSIRRLPHRVQQRAMALASWREREAIRRNLPRQWVLKDEGLVNASFRKPDDIKAVQEVAGIGHKTGARHGKAIIETIGGDLPEPPGPTERPDAESRALQKAMALQVKTVAAELEIESEVLAPQREIRQAAVGNTDIRALKGWRQPLLEPVLSPLIPA